MPQRQLQQRQQAASLGTAAGQLLGLPAATAAIGAGLGGVTGYMVAGHIMAPSSYMREDEREKEGQAKAGIVRARETEFGRRLRL
jgi:hypothetical protein